MTGAGAGTGGGPLRRLARGVGRLVLVALGALAAVFAVANRQRVEFSWLVGETRVAVDASGEVVGGVPLFVLLLAALGTGLLLGMLLTWRRRGARTRRG